LVALRPVSNISCIFRARTSSTLLINIQLRRDVATGERNLTLIGKMKRIDEKVILL
jgi:hypothetical protein